MSDIENRLRADAMQIEAPPDFAAAVKTATMHRPRSHVWLAAAAAILLIAGGSAALTWRDAGSGGSTAAESAHSSIAAAPSVPSIVGAIVAPDPASAEMALIIRQPGTTSSTCPQSLPSLTESSTEVRVRLGNPSAESLAPGSCFVSMITEDGTVVGRPRINLTPSWGAEYSLYLPQMDRPLGTRPLIDDATGLPIKVLDVEPPTPGQVPDGYTVKPADNPMSSVWLNFQPGALAPLAVQRTYTNADGVRLVFVHAASAHVTAGAKTIDHVVVDGRDATVTESPQTRCVTWAPTTGSGMQVCSDISRAKPATGPSELIAEADLLRVASDLQ